MNQKTILLQACICIAVLAVWQGGLTMQHEKLGNFLEKAAEAIEKNYTLAELLELGQDAAETAADLPAAFSEAVLTASQTSYFGTPLDADTEDPIKNVYAAAGGRVVRCGIRDGLGMYVILEHPGSLSSSGKISTYGHLSAIRVVSGERIKRGDILGSYDRDSGEDFYYVIEDKSGNSF